jgi:hypothetical protein
VNPAAEGSEPSGHPNGRKADSGWPRRSVKPDPSGHCRFDTCSAHLSPRSSEERAPVSGTGRGGSIPSEDATVWPNG